MRALVLSVLVTSLPALAGISGTFPLPVNTGTTVDGGSVRIQSVQIYGQDENNKLWPLFSTDEGRIRTVAEPVELYVNRDARFDGKDARVIQVLGRRSQGYTNTTDLQDVVQYLDTSQALENEANPATTYYVRSSSASDNIVNGTGARSVRYTFVPSDGGLEQSATVNLDGGSPQNIGAGYAAFQWAEVASLGSSEVSAGNITISSTSTTADPAVATIVEYIAAGGNRSQSGRYKVPYGYTGYVLAWEGSAVGNNQDLRLRAQAFSDNGHAASTVYHFLSTSYVIGGTAGFNSPMHYWKIPGGSDVKLSTIPTAAGSANRLDANFYMLIQAN
jgi:hypothetical protein